MDTIMEGASAYDSFLDLTAVQYQGDILGDCTWLDPRRRHLLLDVGFCSDLAAPP